MEAGSDGRWSHALDVFDFMLSHRTMTLRETSLHEAGHVVVAHDLGIQIEFATGRPVREADTIVAGGRTRLGGEYAERFAHEEGVLESLAGLAVDEHIHRRQPLILGDHEDSGYAISNALGLAGGDPKGTAIQLRSARAFLHGVIEDLWTSIVAVAAELEKRNLRLGDVERILGPTPSPSYQRARRTLSSYSNAADFAPSIAAILDGRPYGCAVSPAAFQLGEGFAWIHTSGDLQFTVPTKPGMATSTLLRAACAPSH